MEKILKLYTYVDGINDIPFPNDEEVASNLLTEMGNYFLWENGGEILLEKAVIRDIGHILATEMGDKFLWENGDEVLLEKSEMKRALVEKAKKERIDIYSFEYNANRMGDVPCIDAKVKYGFCLDSLWTDKVYAMFNGERYFVKEVPSSSKDSNDERYEHDVHLVSERNILRNVYFIDAVQGNSDIDKAKTNTTKVQFMGDLKEFVERLNSSLSYSGLEYRAVIDDGIDTDNKIISFEDKYILESLQEAFTQYNIPYYFKDKVIHFGYTDNAIPTTLRYGSNDALLSISKNNSNFRLINRISGCGSSDNIPFYYPNKSEKGEVGVSVPPSNKKLKEGNIRIIDPQKFAHNAELGSYIIYNSGDVSINDTMVDFGQGFKPSGTYNVKVEGVNDVVYKVKMNITSNIKSSVVIKPILDLNGRILPLSYIESSYKKVGDSSISLFYSGDNLIVGDVNGTTEVGITYRIPYQGTNTYSIHYMSSISTEGGWTQGNKTITLDEIGISIDITPDNGDSFTQVKKGWIIPSQSLMPPIYRESLGKERFYNAENGVYDDGEGGTYEFDNLYSSNNPYEGKVDFSEIRPSIVGMANENGERIDTFIEFAYDENDDDSYDDKTNEYNHPYFFAKMHKTNGKFGFNLFDQANEKQSMQISMTMGTCGACTFEVGVGEKTQKNIVQVDSKGNLLRDKEGNVLRSGEPQIRQNDTVNNEVWIALKKDDNTYPSMSPMPNSRANLKPSTKDTFVILGITMPQAYIDAAEEKLKKSLIKYMWMNNKEKFNFSVKLSRIYMQEHEDILNSLNENSRVLVEYDGIEYPLYVDSYSYKMDGEYPLPEININLVDNIVAGKNSLQSALDNVKQDILSSIGGNDFLKQGLKYFLRKDVNDTARGLITFLGGANFGNFIKGIGGANIDELGNIIAHKLESHGYSKGTLGTGFVLKNDPDTNRSYMEVDELFVRVKAMFTELEIKKLSYAGGNWIFSPAGMTCTQVEDKGTFYRCHFVSENKEVKVENEFRANDLVRCQEFNVKDRVSHNISNRYYWMKCINAENDYIDLSKSDKDASSNSYPMVGDSMVALGNSNDVTRQNAIVISAYGEGSPSITQHSGIKSYTLEGTEKTRIAPNNNIFTGKFYFDSGVNVKEYTDSKINDTNKRVDKAEQEIEASSNIVDKLKVDVDEIKKQSDGAIETWFAEEAPTLDNYPAVNWTDVETKEKHLADMYYDGSGKAYRFSKNGDGSYEWKLITDSGVTDALNKIKDLEAVVDGKMKVFVRKPKVEESYDIGDLWIDATIGDFKNELLVCVHPKKEKAPILNSDWGKATKYTDDSATNKLREETNGRFEATDEKFNSYLTLNTYKVDQEGIKTRLSSAESSINQNATDISLRVTRKDFDQNNEWMDDRISSNTSSIKVNSESITQQSSRIDTINGKVEEHSSWIQTAPDSISAKVKEDVNGELSLTGIDIKNKEIKLTAQKTWFTNSTGKSIASFSDDGDGGIKFDANVYCTYIKAVKGTIGGFTLTNSSIGSADANNKLRLTAKGISFDSEEKTAGIGDTLPGTFGGNDMIAAIFNTKLHPSDLQEGVGVVNVETKGGTIQTGIKIDTDGREFDYALDLKGKIKMRDANEVEYAGLTYIMRVDAVNSQGRPQGAILHFVNGILTRVQWI